MTKPPLGPMPVLPPRAYCERHTGSRYDGEPCPNCRPVGGPHLFALPDASAAVRAEVHRLHQEGNA